jgi:hypothetical protein
VLKRFGLVAMGAGVVLGGFGAGGQAWAQPLTPVTIDGVDAFHHLDFPPTLCRANVSVQVVQVPLQHDCTRADGRAR